MQIHRLFTTENCTHANVKQCSVQNAVFIRARPESIAGGKLTCFRCEIQTEQLWFLRKLVCMKLVFFEKSFTERTQLVKTKQLVVYHRFREKQQGNKSKSISNSCNVPTQGLHEIVRLPSTLDAGG